MVFRGGDVLFTIAALFLTIICGCTGYYLNLDNLHPRMALRNYHVSHKHYRYRSRISWINNSRSQSFVFYSPDKPKFLVLETINGRTVFVSLRKGAKTPDGIIIEPESKLPFFRVLDFVIDSK